MDLWSVFMVPLLLLIAANDLTTAGMDTGVRPKGAGGASAPPMKNYSACRNKKEPWNILSEQK